MGVELEYRGDGATHKLICMIEICVKLRINKWLMLRKIKRPSG